MRAPCKLSTLTAAHAMGWLCCTGQCKKCDWWTSTPDALHPFTCLLLMLMPGCMITRRLVGDGCTSQLSRSITWSTSWCKCGKTQVQAQAEHAIFACRLQQDALSVRAAMDPPPPPPPPPLRIIKQSNWPLKVVQVSRAYHYSHLCSPPPPPLPALSFTIQILLR